MKIRQAKLEDLDRIVEIELENFSVEEAIPHSVFEAHFARNSDLVSGCRKRRQNHGVYRRASWTTPPSARSVFTEEIEDYSYESGGYISVTCLSIAKEAQGIGLGKKLLTALKEVALEDKREGINLTCHDYLIAYYEKHGFVNEGLSQSTFAGETWYDMVWQAKK